MKCADKALEVDPMDKYALVLKGEILNSLAQHDEAIKYYDKIICKDDVTGQDSWHHYALTLKGNALSSLANMTKL
jgi:tetratricopeptide (TPR) repeat protein